MAEKHLQKSWKIRFRISCHETVVKKQNLSYHRNRPNICIENYTFGGNGRVEDEEERILPIFIAFFLGLLFPHLIFLPWRMWRHICFPNVNNNVENHRMFWPKSYSILFPEATQNETWEKILKFSVQNHNRTWTHTNFPSKITFQSLFCVNTELMVSHPNSSDGFDENPNQDFFWTLEIEVKMVRLWLLWEKLLMRIFFLGEKQEALITSAHHRFCWRKS